MAQVVETPEIASVADGVTAAFSIPFTFTDSGEVKVSVLEADGTRTDQAEGVDYDVAGANVVFKAGKVPAAQARVERVRRTPASQPEAFGDDATFRPVANEEAFDKLTRGLQEARAQGDRAVTAPVSEAGVTLPPAAMRAGRLAIWNEDGSALDPDGRTLTAFDADVAATALQRALAAQEAVAALASAQAALRHYLDVLEIQATGGDVAVAVGTRIPKNTDGSDFAFPNAVRQALGAPATAELFPAAEVTIRVPTDAATLQAAIDAAATIRPKGGEQVVVLIESGHQIAPGAKTPRRGGSTAAMLCEGSFDHVSIRAEDAVVEVADGFTGNIMRAFGGAAPRLECLIDMRGLGTDGWCHEGGATGFIKADCGVINGGRYGFLSRSSGFEMDDSIWDGGGSNCIHITQGSRGSGRGVSARNGATGIYVSRSSVFHGDESSLARTCDVSGSSVIGFDVSRSVASFRGSKATGCAIAMQIGSRAVVHADNVDCSGSTGSQAVQVEGGMLRCDGANLDGAAGSGMRVNGGYVAGRAMSAKNCGAYGIRADYGSALVDVSGGDFSGAGSNGIEARDGARIIANGANATGATGTGMQVTTGGTIVALGATGTVGRAKNKYVAPHGWIFTSDVLENTGTATIPSGATSIVVNHGLTTGSGVAARNISVTPTNSMGAASKFWVTAVGDTSFTINVDADPAANATFAWQARV